MGAPSIVFGAVGRAAASVLVVALILLIAAPASDALLTSLSSLRRWPEVRASLEKASNEVGSLADAADGRFERLRGRPASEMRERLDAIDKDVEKLSKAPRLASTSYLDLAQTLASGNLEVAVRADVQRRVLLQERDAVRFLYFHALTIGSHQEQRQHVARLLRLKAAAKEREALAESRARRLENDPWCLLPGTACTSELSKARREWRDANAEAWRTHRDWEAADVMLRRNPVTGPAPLFKTDRTSVQAVLDDMSREVARAASWHVTTAQPISDALYAAILVVSASLALVVGMKAFFYFGLARVAERRPPLVVRDGAKRASIGNGSKSALSLQILLLPEQELVVVGSHLQSVADGMRSRTKWLLSTSFPATSLLSGLWMLTRLHTLVPCTVVVSSTSNALEELNTVTLEEGDALVLLPKHLVGVIHPVGGHVRLRGHWKGGVHAWLTLQFRYLVIDGPCTLIFGGCRGVRVENAESGRTVSQAMTVGFSSHVAYSVARTETFMAYLLGQRPLFNDRFHGPGEVLYQEMPSSAQHAGFTGRGLQGVVDGAMKAFGL